MKGVIRILFKEGDTDYEMRIDLDDPANALAEAGMESYAPDPRPDYFGRVLFPELRSEVKVRNFVKYSVIVTPPLSRAARWARALRGIA